MKRKLLKIYFFVFGVVVFFASLAGVTQLFNVFSYKMQEILFSIYFLIHVATFVAGFNHIYQIAYHNGYNDAKKGENNEP